MVTFRAGHSLPELIVAVTFLATTIGGIGGATVLGARWTADAVARQQAVGFAATVLDSLVADSTAASGEAVVEGLTVRWTAGAGGRIRVEVSRPGHRPLAHLEGVRHSALTLPDAGAPAEGVP